ARSGTNRRVAEHFAVLPGAGTQAPWQHRIQREGYLPGKADLSAMRVAAQEQIKTCMGRLTIDFRRVRQQDRKRPIWDGRGSLFDIVDLEIVGVIDAREVDRLIAASNDLTLVLQHADAHGFEAGEHPNRVVIAQHAEDRFPQVAHELCHALQGGVMRTEGLSTKIARQYAGVVLQSFNKLSEPQHAPLVHVDVGIADVKDGESIKQRWQSGTSDVVGPQHDVLGIPATTPVQTAELQRGPDDGVNRVPVLDMKEIEALAENLRFVVGLDAQPLAGMQLSEPLLQSGEELILCFGVHHAWTSVCGRRTSTGGPALSQRRPTAM